MTLQRRLGLSFVAVLALLAAHATLYAWGIVHRDAILLRVEAATVAYGPDETMAALEDLKTHERRLQLLLSSTYGVMGLLVVVLAVSGRRHVQGGFAALRHGASAIADGDLPHRVREAGTDEFATLGKVFNSLSHDLALSQRQLTITNRELEKRNREIDEQRRISDSLLRNILPGEVAEELSAHGEVTPRVFDDVTILFTDFVGFTPSTEHLDAKELVRILHDYFTDFDKIARRYRLEKLKTIGDSYMCVGGLPRRTSTHPVDVTLAGLEMLHAVRERARSPLVPGWEVRIGIHTGSVIAGVVGIDKFAFDVWGETVNFSSRVESTGLPNRINVSASTYHRARDFFEFEPRGKVRTKENREYDMFFVHAVREDLLGAKGAIAPRGFEHRYRELFDRDPVAFPEFLLPEAPR